MLSNALGAGALDDLLFAIIVIGGVAYCVWSTLLLLGRGRPELDLAEPVAVGLGLRLVAAVVVSLPAADALRAPDEKWWLEQARSLAAHGLLSRQSADAAGSTLHEWLFSLEVRAEFPELAMRIVQVGIGMVGLVLLATAVHDLAGRRASRTAAWLLGLEPTSIFFGGALLKESLMLLAIGLVAVGGTHLWKDARPSGLLPAVAGCVVALATRPYAGWFLVAGVTALLLHRMLRREPAGADRGLLLGLAACAVVVLAIPTLSRLSSPESLQTLAVSQQGTIAAAGNLTLEPVDFGSRTGLLTSLPHRVRDVVLRPYPWQVGTIRQQVGVLGSLVALGALAYLLTLFWANRGTVMRRTAPLMYPASFLLAAYSLASANAGTSFRYRTQLVALGIAIVAVLRAPADGTD